MGPRFTLEGQTILENGVPCAVVQPAQAGSDIGPRLVSLLNLADRDEVLLDHIGEMVTQRNIV